MAVNLGTIYAEIALRLDKFDKGLREAEAAIKVAEKRLEGFKETGERLTSIGKNLTTKVTLPIMGLAAAGVKAFSDFDDAMTGSLAIMGNVSEEMRERMEGTARDIAKETRFSASQAAEAYFFLASAGLDAAQSIEALPRVAKFATAGKFDLARATDLLTDAQSALGLASKDTAENMRNMERVSDVLVKANTLANASVEQFSESLTNKAGAALRLLNKDVEEGVAVLAVFADQGLKGAAAGESLNIVMRDLQRTAINNKEEFKELGISVFDAEGNMRNIADIIGDLENALDGMSDEQVRATLMMLGFQDRSVSAMMALLGTSDAIREYEKELRNASGITEEVADKQMESLAARLDKVKSKLWDAAITIGEHLVPIVERLAGWIERLVERFDNLSPWMQKAIIYFALLVAAIGPVIWFAGVLFGSIYKIQVGMTFLSKTVIPLLVKGIGLLGKALMFLFANPIGLIILGITALIAAGYLLYKNWDTVKEKVVELWVSLKEWAVSTWEALKGWLAETWETMKTSAIAAWESIVLWFQELPGRVKEWLSKLGEFLVKLLVEDIPFWLGYAIGSFIRWSLEMREKALETGKAVLDSIIQFIKELPGRVWEWLVNTAVRLRQFAIEARGRAIEAGRSVLENVVTFIRELPGRIWDWLLRTADRVTSFASEARTRAISAGRNIINGIVDTIRSLPGEVWNILTQTARRLLDIGGTLWRNAREAASNLWNGFKRGLGIASPSYIEKALEKIIESSGETLDKLKKDFSALSRLKVEPQISPGISPVPALAVATAPVPAPGLGQSFYDQRINGPLVVVENMTVRSEEDIETLSRKLYRYIEAANRGRGRL